VAPAVKPTQPGSSQTDATRAELRRVEKLEAKAKTPAGQKQDHELEELLRERLQHGE
jgi:hypothetical protein